MMHAQAQHQAAAPASTCVFATWPRVCVLYAIDAAPFTLSASHELSRTALHAVDETREVPAASMWSAVDAT